MRTTFLLSAVLAASGCATAPHPATVGACMIEEAPWPSADAAFDRRLTLQVIGSLRDAAEADQRAFAEGRRAEIGDRLSAMSRTPATSAFISSGVAELASRLRQLDCAIRADRVPPEVVPQRYAQILGELSAEQATLEPRGGVLRSVAP